MACHQSCKEHTVDQGQATSGTFAKSVPGAGFYWPFDSNDVCCESLSKIQMIKRFAGRILIPSHTKKQSLLSKVSLLSLTFKTQRAVLETEFHK